MSPKPTVSSIGSAAVFVLSLAISVGAHAQSANDNDLPAFRTVAHTISFQSQPANQPEDEESAEITTRTGRTRAGEKLAVGDIGLEITGGGGYTFPADFKGTDGDVSLTRAGGAVDISFRPAEAFTFAVGVDVELTFTDFDDASGVLAGMSEPFDDLYRTGVRASAAYSFNRQWSLIFGAGVEWALEDGADADEAATGGGYVAVGHRFSDSFSMQFGATVISRFDNDALVVPFIAFQWQITEATALRSNGLKLELSHALFQELELFATAGPEFRQYRLAEDRARVHDGSMSDIRIPIGGGLRFSPSGSIMLSLEGGFIAWQEYSFFSSSGVKVSDVETDPTGYLAALIRIEF